MSARVYTDRELVCAHLRAHVNAVFGDRALADLVRPDASDDEWSEVMRAVHKTAEPHIIHALDMLRENRNDAAARALVHIGRVATDRSWREWVQRECTAELAAVTAPKPSKTPEEQPTPEVRITPELTLAEFFRVCIAARGAVTVSGRSDGFEIAGKPVGADVAAACVAYYQQTVRELEGRAVDAQETADRLRAVLAKAVTL